MNSMMQQQGSVLEETQALRNQLMDGLMDEDLGYSPGGENPTLGGLCREMGEVQQAYIRSFRTFALEFDCRAEDPELEGSVARLAEWFEALDGEMQEVLESLSEEEIQNRVIDRQGGFVIPPAMQLHIYREALLIFYGKASVYLKALGKERTQQWRVWIA